MEIPIRASVHPGARASRTGAFLGSELVAAATVHERPPLSEPSPDNRRAWAAELLDGSADPAWAHEGKRLLVGLGLASLFGAAVGLRLGGAAIFVHALGVPAGILAVTALATPALAIVLALVDAPVDALALARATSRGAAHAGLLLGGLAPAAALFVVTVEDAITVTVMGFGALLLAGAVAVRAFVQELGPRVAAAPARKRRLLAFAGPSFLVFAAALALRTWWVTLSILTGTP